MIPLWLFVVVLLAGPLVSLTGAVLGAFLFHRARTNRSPIPTVRDVVEAWRVPAKPVEEKAKTVAPRLRV